MGNLVFTFCSSPQCNWFSKAVDAVFVLWLMLVQRPSSVTSPVPTAPPRGLLFNILYFSHDHRDGVWIAKSEPDPLDVHTNRIHEPGESNTLLLQRFIRDGGSSEMENDTDNTAHTWMTVNLFKYIHGLDPQLRRFSTCRRYQWRIPRGERKALWELA